MSDPFSSPEFAKLTYQEQLEVRAEILKNQLMSNPNFMQLSPEDQAAVFKQSVLQPPVFEQGSDLGFVSPKNIEDIKAGKWTPEKSTLWQWQPQGGKGGVATERFASGVVQGGDLLFGAWKLFRKALVGEKAGDADTRNESKLEEWNRISASEDPSIAGIASLSNTLGNMAGTAAEMAIPYTKAIGSIAKPAGLTKAIINGLNKIKPVANILAKSGAVAYGIRSLVDVGASALFGAVMENATDLVNERMKNATFADIASKTVNYLGEGALMGLIFNGAGMALKTIRAIGTAGRYAFVGPPGARGVRQSMKDALKTHFNDTFVKALTGENIDPRMWTQYGDPQYTTMMNNLVTTGKLLKNIETPTQEAVIKATGLATVTPVGKKLQGFLMSQDEKGLWKAVGSLDEKVYGTFKTNDDAMNFLTKMNDILPETKVKEIATLGTATKNMQVVEKVRALLPEESPERLKVLSGVIAPVGGTFNSTNVKTFSKEFLRSSGVSEDVFNKVLIEEAENALKIKAGKSVIELPKSVKTPDEEITAIKSLIDGLNAEVPQGATSRALSKNILDNYQKITAKSQIKYTPTWIYDTIQNDFGGKIANLPDGKISVTFPSGKTWNPENLQELGNRLLVDKMTDPATFKAYLSNYTGATLQQTSNGFKVVKGKTVIAEGGTIEEILSNNPQLLPKIPIEYGPKFTFIQPKELGGSSEIYYENKIAVGNAKTLLEELDKFGDTSTASRKSSISGEKLTYDHVLKEFEVYMPELNTSKTFKSIGEAKKFISAGAKDFEVMEYAANRKLWKMGVSGNKWHLYSEEGHKVFNNAEEVRNFLKEAPNPTAAPELTGIEEEFFKELKEIPDLSTGDPLFKAPFPYETPAKMTPGWIAQNFLRPVDAQLLAALEKAGPQGEMLLKFYRRIESQRTVFAKLFGDTGNTLLEGLKIDGKRMVKKEKRLFWELLKNDLNDPKINDVVKELGLTPAHLDAAKKARFMFDEMFKEFKVNPNKYLTEYLPRMERYIFSGKASKFSDSELENFLKGEFKGIGAGDLTAAFQYARTTDVVSFLQETDIEKVMLKYTSMGFREKLFNPIMTDLRKWAGQNMGKVDPQLLSRFTAYLQDFLGVPSGFSEKSLRAITTGIFEKLGKAAPSGTLVDSIIKLGYGAYIGWRPFTAIRNLTQVIQCLGWRIGNTKVFNAMDKIALDKEGKLIRMLENAGGIPPEYPYFLGEGAPGISKAKKFLFESPLEWIKKGDNYNRVVSYIAATDAFDEGMKKFQPGVLSSIDDVVKDGKLWNLPKDLLARTKQMISEGKIADARHLFGTTMVKETMFEYRKGLMPYVFRGSLGKMFGQFGSFFVNYIQNLRNGFSRAPGAEKAKVLINFAANAAALSGVFAAFGLKTSDFIPGPVTFAGGPYFDLMTKMLKGFENSYEGRQARSEIYGFKEVDGKITLDVKGFFSSGIGSQFIPGSLAFKSIMKGIEYLNAGDIYHATLAFTSAPIAKTDDPFNQIIERATGGVLPLGQ